MKIQPLDSYRSPQIPTRDYVDNNPEILNHIPRRWMSDAAVLTALAGTTMLLSSCKTNKVKTTINDKLTSVLHRGNAGTVSLGKVIPPVYLSEDTAKDIIRKEAAKQGIIFDISDNAQKSVRVPTITSKNKNLYTTVIFDGTNKKRNIMFEVISTTDAASLRVNKVVPADSSMYDTMKAAATLQNKLRKAYPHGKYGVFYNPPIYPSEYMNTTVKRSTTELTNSQKLAKSRVKQLLRAQVKDFIKWLKSEGVI